MLPDYVFSPTGYRYTVWFITMFSTGNFRILPADSFNYLFNFNPLFVK